METNTLSPTPPAAPESPPESLREGSSDEVRDFREGQAAGTQAENERRELDRAVAAALGWTGISYGYTTKSGGAYSGVPPGERRLRKVPRYSSEIRAAWECVTWLEERCGFEGYNGFNLVRLDEKGKQVEWYCEVGDPSWEYATAPTPAEAICLCFLEVLAANPELKGATS